MKVMKLTLNGHGLCDGIFEGEAIVSQKPFGFWQGIDPLSGIVIDKRHDLFGESIKNKAFVYPYGRGSTGTPGIFLEAVKNQVAPAAIINLKSEPMIIVCALLSDAFYQTKIPTVDQLDKNPMETIKTGDRIYINGKTGIVKIIC